MSADLTTAYNEWSGAMYDALQANYVDADWAALTIPTGSCLASAKVSVFSVDLDAFTTLCASTTGCTFDAADYKPYAFGVLFT
jgi:hypothetical protein